MQRAHILITYPEASHYGALAAAIYDLAAPVVPDQRVERRNITPTVSAPMMVYRFWVDGCDEAVRVHMMLRALHPYLEFETDYETINEDEPTDTASAAD